MHHLLQFTIMQVKIRKLKHMLLFLLKSCYNFYGVRIHYSSKWKFTKMTLKSHWRAHLWNSWCLPVSPRFGWMLGMKSLWAIVTAYGNRSIYLWRPIFVDYIYELGLNLFLAKVRNSVAWLEWKCGNYGQLSYKVYILY